MIFSCLFCCMTSPAAANFTSRAPCQIVLQYVEIAYFLNVGEQLRRADENILLFLLCISIQALMQVLEVCCSSVTMNRVCLHNCDLIRMHYIHLPCRWRSPRKIYPSQKISETYLLALMIQATNTQRIYFTWQFETSYLSPSTPQKYTYHMGNSRSRVRWRPACPLGFLKSWTSYYRQCVASKWFIHCNEIIWQSQDSNAADKDHPP